MAGSVNKVILIGNLGQDPEVKSFQNGGRIANLRIATSENWKDKNTGERKERTEWHTVVLQSEGLVPKLQARWTLPTALAFLAWFVFAPQCLSTIAVARRETNGWKWPLFMLAYLFALAYIFAGITYWLAVAAGL